MPDAFFDQGSHVWGNEFVRSTKTISQLWKTCNKRQSHCTDLDFRQTEQVTDFSRFSVSRMSLTIFRLTVFTRHTWTLGTAEVQDINFFFQLQRTSLAFNVGCSTVELLVPNSANNRRLCLHKLYNHALFNTIKRVLPLMWEYSCSSSKTLVAVKSSLYSVLLRWGGTVLLCCIIYCFVFPS